MKRIENERKRLVNSVLSDANTIYYNKFMYNYIVMFTKVHNFDICLTTAGDRQKILRVVDVASATEFVEGKAAVFPFMTPEKDLVFTKEEFAAACIHKYNPSFISNTNNTVGNGSTRDVSTRESMSALSKANITQSPKKNLSISYGPQPTKRASALVVGQTNLSGSQSFNYENNHATSFTSILAFFGQDNHLNDYICSGVDTTGFQKIIPKLLLILKSELTRYLTTLHPLPHHDSYFPPNYTTLLSTTLIRYFSSKLYHSTIQKSPTVRDFAFYLQCRSLKFISLSLSVKHKPTLSLTAPYLQPAIDCIKTIDSGGGIYEILEKINESMEIIVQTIYIVLNPKESPGNDDILPIWVYCVVKACPKRMYSLSNFIKTF